MTKAVNLYNKVKDHLPDLKGVISDESFIMTGRKEYQLSQVSPSFPILEALGARISYTFRTYIALLDQFAASLNPTHIGADFNLFLSDPAMTVPGLIAYLRAGGSETKGAIFAPRGIAKLPRSDGLLGEMILEFNSKVNSRPDATIEHSRRQAFSFILGNSKQSTQMVLAARTFASASCGVMLIKDYASLQSPDEREFLESQRIFPGITLDGHAIAIKL